MERIDDILEIHRTIQQMGLRLGVGWYLNFQLSTVLAIL